MRSLKRHLTYANVMSTIAVAVAVGGGTAYAVVAAKDSVVSSSVKDHALMARDISTGGVSERTIRRDAVTGAKVDDGSLSGVDVEDDSLTAADVDELQLDTVSSANSLAAGGRRLSDVIDVPPGAYYTLYAQCDLTWTAVGGGYIMWSVDENGQNPEPDPNMYVTASRNYDAPNANAPAGSRWVVDVKNFGTRLGKIQVSAQCVPFAPPPGDSRRARRK